MSIILGYVFTSILGFPQIEPPDFGGEVGNGGDVIICRDDTGKVTRVELLDAYEAVDVNQFKMGLGAADLSVKDKFEIMMKRLDRVSPARATLYRHQFEVFDKEASYLDNVDLEDIPDSKHVVKPEGCKVEQLVVQRDPIFSRDRRYTFDNDWWKQLSNDSKAMTYFHEIAFREVLHQVKPHKNSIKVRYFNGFFASADIDQMQDNEIQEVIDKMGFTNMEWNGLLVKTGGYSKPSYGEPQLLDPDGDRTADPAQGLPVVSEVFAYEKQSFPITGLATFYPNHKVNSLLLPEDQILEINGLKLNVKGHSAKERADQYCGTESSQSIFFGEDSKIVMVCLSGVQTISWQGQEIKIENVITFDNEGKISNFHLAEPTAFEFKNQKFDLVGPVSLKNNRIIEANLAHTTQVESQNFRGKILGSTQNHLWPIRFFETGEVQYAWIQEGEAFIENKWIPLAPGEFPQGIEFFESGELRTAKFSSFATFSIWKVDYETTQWERYSDGAIAYAKFVPNSEAKFFIGDKWVWFQNEAYLYKGGRTKSSVLAHAANFKTADGRIVACNRGDRLGFTKDGLLAVREAQGYYREKTSYIPEQDFDFKTYGLKNLE